MSRYVIDASVVRQLLREGVKVAHEHDLVAPTLLRSQVLEALYRSVRSGEPTEAAGLDPLARFATMKFRFLGDKVLRSTAWSVTDRLEWGPILDAEFIALTLLQADAFVTLDPRLATSARELGPTATLADLLGGR